ncbi:MAG: hypothetical protein LQ347_001215 [Umbilicaria vellea]|nr:MAG: hypothetical protein LQ347_001215 [Umbilicaria vellea]
MSAEHYAQYGGNPYEQTSHEPAPFAERLDAQDEAVGVVHSNTRFVQHLQPTMPVNYELSNYSGGSNYSGSNHRLSNYGPPGSNILSQEDFLARIEAIRSSIATLTTHVSQIATLHQRSLSSPESASSAELEHKVTQTQILNTQIKDQIKRLELDAAKTPDAGLKRTKDTQVGGLKRGFKRELETYQQEESEYRQRYREQIARQYRIVNPNATDSEVNEAASADWGNEGVFQTALKSNRSSTANSALGAVRARHNEIQRIEATIADLGLLFQQLAEQVEVQEYATVQIEQGATHVVENVDKGNTQLDVANRHARRTRKMKWWCFFIVVLICCILGLVLGLYFGLKHK